MTSYPPVCVYKSLEGLGVLSMSSRSGPLHPSSSETHLNDGYRKGEEDRRRGGTLRDPRPYGVRDRTLRPVRTGKTEREGLRRSFPTRTGSPPTTPSLLTHVSLRVCPFLPVSDPTGGSPGSQSDPVPELLP